MLKLSHYCCVGLFLLLGACGGGESVKEESSPTTSANTTTDTAATSQTSSSGYEYHVYHILISTPRGASAADMTTLQTQAERVLKMVKEGENFQGVAATVSNSPSAETGGDLGWRTLSELPSLFTDTVKTMQVGDVSDLIRNDSGFHIIKLADKRPTQRK
ncbi:parvulin-like peptidyl-prolyl isomerase [Beggiatoa alba B18LD]|uniref:Parvulin-like peptidyl-prolyl isomerase n=1 Tax=Beggiatoa alba B18LD TaxID=395493 RepID=I3CDY4_9GAMM|nr:peptidylprolyl isomerase [Beggiatoa alba]EIJ41827.1 parvulin-like peptidyl-prolyl isomerase [Beggiatoa alba B18LD]